MAQTGLISANKRLSVDECSLADTSPTQTHMKTWLSMPKTSAHIFNLAKTRIRHLLGGTPCRKLKANSEENVDTPSSTAVVDAGGYRVSDNPFGIDVTSA